MFDEEKINTLIAEMTLDEKLNMIHGNALFATGGVKRLGILPLVTSDGPMGVRLEFEANRWMPVGNSDDYITYLPCNSALAATWNRKLAFENGSVLGEEARGRGKDVILAPGINIKRTPLCGRNFEYFSEDPYLTKEMAVPFIKGVQEWDVAACVKHFAVNNQETQRLSVDVCVEEDVLREIYLPPFYAAVKEGGAYTIMGAYNQLYGKHCCHSDYLLGKILREEWEYDGVVISDWGGVHDTEQAANTSLDIEMSVYDNFDEYYMANPLKEKIACGEIDESVVDQKIARILKLMNRLNMLDGERKAGSYNTPEHRMQALLAARESVVLLKNEEKRLPLCKEKLGRVLVVGENANLQHAFGGGSSELKALYEITPLMGIKTHLGGNTKVMYAPGYCKDIGMNAPLDEEYPDVAANWQETSLNAETTENEREIQESQEVLQARKKLREEAIALAKTCDTVIYVGGLNHDYDTEGKDRSDMKLPYEQDILIQELLTVCPDMIVVMMAGSQVEMHSWIDKAKAVVWTWYAGMEGGNALADVLFGEINPSGKMPDTMYRTHADCSAHAIGEFPGGDTVHYTEGKYVGYRYLERYDIEPLFPFGHGLSYTHFSYQNLQLDLKANRIVCTIKNDGDIDGAEIVQVYCKNTQSADEDVKVLVGFEKVFLKAGQAKEVRIFVERMQRDDTILVGASIKDIRLCQTVC